MADIESNIDININAASALAELKRLQSEISRFHTQMAKGNAAAAAQSAALQRNLVDSINSSSKFLATTTRIQSSAEAFNTALEKNKLSMGEYFRYAGGATQTFGKLFRTEFDTINKVARERVKTLQTQYIKLGRDANNSIKAIAVRPLALDMKDLGTQTAIAAQKAQILNQVIKQGSTSLLNWGKNTQWAGRQLMVGFSIPLGIAGSMAAKEFMKLEEQVLRFQRVYGDSFTSTTEVDNMTSQIKELASEFTKYGIAVEKTMGIAADAAAMGKTGAALRAQVSEATRLSVLGGVEQEQALQTTISLTNAFGTASAKLSSKVDFLNAVENQTVTSIEDLTEAIPKAGPVIQQLGGDVEDLTFFLTAMREGGINASEGANALKSGLASLINPTAVASDMLAGFGINIQGIVNANKGDVKGIVIDFAKALDKLDPLNRAQAIEQLFGKFQFARMSTLFQNVIAEGSQASRVLDLTRASAAELAVLSKRELKRIEDSPMYKFKKAMEDFKASIVPLGEAFLKAVTPIVQFSTDVLNKFNEMDDGVKNFIVTATGLVAGLGPILLMTVGLVANGVANLIKFIQLIVNGFRRMTGGSKVLGEQIGYMTQQQLEAASVAASLDQVHNNLIQTFTSERSEVYKLAQAYEQAAAKQRSMMAPTNRSKRTATRRMATGGIISGPGTGTSDSIPAMLSNGEAVIPAKNVKRFPAMVAGLVAGNIPGFAEGTEYASSTIDLQAEGKRGRRSVAQQLAIIAEKSNKASAQALLDMIDRFGVAHGEGIKLIAAVANRAEKGIESVEESSKKLLAGLERRAANNSKDSGMVGVSSQLRNEIFGAQEARQQKTFAHIGAGIDYASSEFIKKFGTDVLDTKSKRELDRLLARGLDPLVSIKSGLGLSGISQGLNTKLRKSGAAKSDVYKEVKGLGPDAWAQSIKIGGGNFKALNKDIQSFHRVFTNLIGSVAEGTKIFDTRVDAERWMAQNTGELATSMEELYSQARLSASPELRGVLDTAHSTATEIRVAGAGSGRRAANLPASLSIPLAAKAAEEAVGWQKATAKDAKESFTRKQRETYNEQNAAGKRAMTLKKIEELNSKRRIEAEKQLRVSETQTANDRDHASKMDAVNRAAEAAAMDDAGFVAAGASGAGKTKKYGRFQRIANRTAGVSAGIGTAAMMGSMAGGTVGDISQQIMGPAMLLSMIGPMLPGLIKVITAHPIIAGIVVAIAAVAGAIWALVDSTNKQAEAGRKLADAMSMGTDKITKLSEATGTVSATDERRAAEKINKYSPYSKADIKEGKSLLASDYGKQLQQDIKTMQEFGKSDKTISETLGRNLSYAIMQGVITQKQAKNLVGALGEKLKDYDLAIGITGEVRDIVGPNGENLAKDPLSVAMEIQNKSIAKTKLAFENMFSKTGGMSDVFAVKDGEFGYVNNELAAAGIEMGLEQISINNGLVDSLNKQYEIKKQEATTQEEINRLEAERKTAVDKLISKNAEYTQDLIQQAQWMGGTWLYDSAVKQVKDLYKGAEETYATTAMEQIKNQFGANDEFTINFVAAVSTGELDPQVAMQLAKMAKENPEISTTYTLVMQSVGDIAGTQLISALVSAGLNSKEIDTAVNLVLRKKDPENVQDVIDAMNMLTSVQQSIDVKFNLGGTDIQEVTDMQQALNAVNGETITKDVAINMQGMGIEGMSGLLQYWDMFKNTDGTINKDIVLRFAALYQGDAALIKAYITANPELLAKYDANNNGKIDKKAYRNKKLKADAAAWAMNDISMTTAKTDGASSTTTDSTKEQEIASSFLDDIVKKVKNLKYAAIDLTKGWRASMDALMKFTNTGQSGFNGIDQQLRRLGAGEDAINLITGMSAEDWAQYKDELFAFDAAGNITGLRAGFASIGTALREIKLGEFFSEQQKVTAAVGYQQQAITKLTSSGMSYANALEVVKDTELARAIATNASTDELRQLSDATEKATKLAKQYAAAQSIISKNTDTKTMRDTVSYLQQYGSAFTDAQREAILNDPDLAASIMEINPYLDPAALQEALDNAANQTQLDLAKNKLTFKGLVSVFEDGFSKAMERFAALQKDIELNFAVKKKPFEDAIKTAQNAISDINNAPGGIDDLSAELDRISVKEEEINKRYDERNKALDSIAAANDRIARQQKSQITLADALTRGDISAAAMAAQEMRAQQASDAIASEKELLDAQRKQELDNITVTMGLTREQIESRIKDLKQQIFDIEENIIEPAQYQIELLDRQMQIEIDSLEVLGRTKDEWEMVGSQIDLAKTGTAEYTAAMETALSVVEDILSYWQALETTFYTKQEVNVHTVYTSETLPPGTPYSPGNGGNSSSNAGNTGNTGNTSSTPNAGSSTVAQTTQLKNQVKHYGALMANTGAWWTAAMGSKPQEMTSAEWEEMKKTSAGSNAMATLWGWNDYWRGRFNQAAASYNRANGAAADVSQWDKGGSTQWRKLATGGIVPSRIAPLGTDTVPTMLTPGEFVVRRAAVDSFGVNNLKAINDGTYNDGSVYNYDISVNVQTDANPDDIARSVMTKIRQVESQRIRGNRF